MEFVKLLCCHIKLHFVTNLGRIIRYNFHTTFITYFIAPVTDLPLLKYGCIPGASKTWIALWIELKRFIVFSNDTKQSDGEAPVL